MKFDSTPKSLYTIRLNTVLDKEGSMLDPKWAVVNLFNYSFDIRLG